MSLVLSGSTSGSVTLQEPAVAGTTVIDLPATSGTMVVTGGAQTIEFADGSASAPSITNSGDTNTGMFFPAADTIAFSEGGTESMRISSTGNVGIGRTPDQRLQIADTTAVEFDMFVGSTRTLTLYADATQTIVAAPTAVPMIFRTTDTERMRLTDAGRLLIGTTASILTGGDNAVLAVQADLTGGNFAMGINSSVGGQVAYINFIRQNTQQGYIYSPSGGGTIYLTSSDYRLKENVTPMAGALAKVAQLKPVTYKWKQSGEEGQGFIAHELQEVFPDAVGGEKDAVDTYTDEDGNEQTRIKPQGIDTSVLVATLTAAIQELKATVDAQAARIAALEGVK
jgi:hypothetical protein